MFQIDIHVNGKIQTCNFDKGQSLLNILQNNDVAIEAPCGGNGTCGKCKVKVKNVGILNSCTYYPENDIEVVLPNKKESQILTHQYANTLKLPLKLSPLAMQSSYPIGLGIDIGTTSVVFYWVNLITGSLIKSTGVQNPQVKYGADVISRINYCSSQEALGMLQKEIVNVINAQILDFIVTEGLELDAVVKISVAANTTMLHLLMGVDPTSIALVPFKATFLDSKHMLASELGIIIHKEGILSLLPSISAYVGADIVAGLASLNPPKEIENYLFIDIGTNGEMALVTPGKIWCCATAAGPAFEGANITCGMGAFDGAISAYDSSGYQTISDNKPVGICGSGLLDVVAYLLNEQIISSDGTLEEDYILATKEQSGNKKDVVITPQDIREVQLAKSAIFTGIKIMLQETGVTYDQIDAVYLAGGFGNYMNPESAVRIGILPSEIKEKIITVGNTSGTGSVLNTISEDFIDHANAVVQKAQLVELAKHPEFEMEFAMNMFF